MESCTEKIDGYDWTVKVGDRFIYEGGVYPSWHPLGLRSLVTITDIEPYPPAHRKKNTFRVWFRADGETEKRRIPVQMLHTHFERSSSPAPSKKATMNQTHKPVVGHTYICIATAFPTEYLHTHPSQLIDKQVMCIKEVPAAPSGIVQCYYRVEAVETAEVLGDFSLSSFNECFKPVPSVPKLGDRFVCMRNFGGVGSLFSSGKTYRVTMNSHVGQGDRGFPVFLMPEDRSNNGAWVGRNTFASFSKVDGEVQKPGAVNAGFFTRDITSPAQVTKLNTELVCRKGIGSSFTEGKTYRVYCAPARNTGCSRIVTVMSDQKKVCTFVVQHYGSNKLAKKLGDSSPVNAVGALAEFFGLPMKKETEKFNSRAIKTKDQLFAGQNLRCIKTHSGFEKGHRFTVKRVYNEDACCYVAVKNCYSHEHVFLVNWKSDGEKIVAHDAHGFKSIAEYFELDKEPTLGDLIKTKLHAQPEVKPTNKSYHGQFSMWTIADATNLAKTKQLKTFFPAPKTGQQATVELQQIGAASNNYAYAPMLTVTLHPTNRTPFQQDCSVSIPMNGLVDYLSSQGYVISKAPVAR